MYVCVVWINLCLIHLIVKCAKNFVGKFKSYNVSHWPGATHGQTIFIESRIRERIHADDFGLYILMGDSGHAAILRYICIEENEEVPPVDIDLDII